MNISIKIHQTNSYYGIFRKHCQIVFIWPEHLESLWSIGGGLIGWLIIGRTYLFEQTQFNTQFKKIKQMVYFMPLEANFKFSRDVIQCNTILPYILICNEEVLSIDKCGYIKLFLTNKTVIRLRTFPYMFL